MNTNLNSSNPVLNDQATFQQAYSHLAGEQRADVATVQGVVNKTVLLVGATIIVGGLTYSFLPISGSIVMFSFLASMIICLGLGFILRGNPKLASIAAPIYAVVEGVALGGFTKLLDGLLIQMGAMASLTAKLGLSEGNFSLAMPAMLITFSVTLGVLGLYKARILRPSERFKAVMKVAIAGVMLTYLSSWILAIFGISIPFLNLGSALQGGTPALIGLGISVLFLGIASLTLVLDFGMVESIVEQGQPKHMEWYAGFALLVTLAWIYYEAVKLSFRLAILFANRD